MNTPNLSEFIKAYDVRGLVPEQLNDAVATAIGSAFAQVVALPDGARVDRRRPRHAPLLTRPGAGLRPRCRRARPGRHADRPVLHRRPLLRQRRARRARCDVHRQPQPGPLQRHQALPLAGAAGGAGQRAGRGPRPGPAAAGRRRRQPAAATGRVGAISERDLLGDYAGFLRGLVDLSGSRPLKVVVDAGNGMGGHTVPAVLGSSESAGSAPGRRGRAGPAAAGRRAAVLRARRHVPQPRGQPAGAGEPARPAARRRRARRRPRAGLRRRRRPLLRGRRAGRAGEPERHHRAGGHPRDRQGAGRRPRRRRRGRSCTTSSPPPPSPRSSPSAAPGRSAPGWGTPSSRARWPATRPCSAGSTPRTTTSATSGTPTPACSRRCTCWPRSVSRTAPCPTWSRSSAATPPRARSTPRSPTPVRPPPPYGSGPRPRTSRSTSSTG